MKTLAEFTRDAFIGFAIGDALGVPVEFETREWLQENPVTEMMGYMRYNQPPGTWSDDSSMVFCTAESLCNGYDLKEIAVNFSRWKNERFWTARGRVFDIGIQTDKSIDRIDRFISTGLHIKPIPELGVNEKENGNGSLMRILPLAFYLKDKPVSERFRIVKEISALTHAHARAVAGCFIYVEFMIRLLEGLDKHHAYMDIQHFIPAFYKEEVRSEEYNYYCRILTNNIAEYPEAIIHSSAYVLHTLEACLWCVMRNDTFSETVLKAVNLGEDTDTVAALAGGLAGMIHGMDQIPQSWLKVLARKSDILELAGRYSSSLSA